MLIGMDEYPFHQIVESFAGAATGDPSWNDGHYFGVTDHAGNVSLTASLRLYPNNDVLDGFVCLRHRGRQYNVRVSRRLRPEIDVLRVGPLSLEIIEPMRRVRLTLAAQRRGHHPRPALHQHHRAGAQPRGDDPGRRAAGERADDVRDRGDVLGDRRGGGGALRARRRLRVVLPQPLVGHAPRSWRPASRSPPPEARSDERRGCGSGCSSTCRATVGTSSSTRAGGPRRAAVC